MIQAVSLLAILALASLLTSCFGTPGGGQLRTIPGRFKPAEPTDPTAMKGSLRSLPGHFKVADLADPAGVPGMLTTYTPPEVEAVPAVEVNTETPK